MRAIAEETFAMVREYKGSHSASTATASCDRNFIRRCSAPASSDDFRQVKHRFDPGHVLNPGKIVDAPKMTTARCFATARLPRR